MIISTTENLQGHKVEKVLGIVRGNTIRAKWFGRDILAGLKQIVGGEIKSYTDMINAARDQALERMINEAKKKGANAIICVRFTTSQVMPQAAEVLAYGTAVKLKK
jgi:uncharacterized protein YbjQ (UPF0145 family)